MVGQSRPDDPGARAQDAASNRGVVTSNNAAGEIDNAEFLGGLFDDAWRDALVTAFRQDPSSDNLPRGTWSPVRAGDFLHTFRPDENSYFCISLFHSTYEVGGRRRVARRKANFASQHLVVVDDVFAKVDAAMILARMGEPTYRLTTSPNNQQWGYCFERPLRLREAGEEIVDAMIHARITADGKDPGMSSVARYVRLPGGRNRKAAYGRDGFQCRLEAWNPERRFDAVALGLVWGVDLHEVWRRVRERAEAVEPPEREVEPPAKYDPRWDNVLRAEDHPYAAKFAPEDLDQEDDSVVRGTRDDPLFLGLRALGLVRGWREGVEAIPCTCPFLHEHTRRADNGSAFMVRKGTLGGGINCFHGHCVGRTRGEYKVEIARRLRERGNPEDLVLAERLNPKKPRRKAPDLDPDPWCGLATACRQFSQTKTRAGDRFDERKALYRLAVDVGRYVAHERVAEDRACSEVEAILRGMDVSGAAWRLALRWGIGKAREEMAP